MKKMGIICLLWSLIQCSCYGGRSIVVPLQETYHEDKPVQVHIKVVSVTADAEMVARILEQCRLVRQYTSVQSNVDVQMNFLNGPEAISKIELKYIGLRNNECNQIYERLHQLSPAIQVMIKNL